MGRVVEAEDVGGGRRLRVRPEGWDHTPAPGDSVCVSGCCLTVVRIDQGGDLAFDAVPETLAKTTLGGWEPGERVNLEHACCADTLLGGHVVQGHVDGVGEVAGVDDSDGRRVRVRVPSELSAYLPPKGSVCVDGVSLTLAEVAPGEGWFEVALIPETLARTTLDALRVGGRVNVECDHIVKSVVHAVRTLVDGGASGGGGGGGGGSGAGTGAAAGG